jgi:hypothetical protein
MRLSNHAPSRIATAARLGLAIAGAASGCGGSPVTLGEQALDAGGSSAGSSAGSTSGASSGSGTGSMTGQESGASSGSSVTAGAGVSSGASTSGSPTSGSASGSGNAGSGSSAGASSGAGVVCGTSTCTSDQICASMPDSCCHPLPVCLSSLLAGMGPGPVCIPAAGCGDAGGGLKDAATDANPALPVGCPASYASVPMQQQCAQDGLACSYAEGWCYCTNPGTLHPLWQCFPPPAAGCPQSPPEAGTSCSQAGLLCDYGYCTGPYLGCTSGAWQYAFETCPNM